MGINEKIHKLNNTLVELRRKKNANYINTKKIKIKKNNNKKPTSQNQTHFMASPHLNTSLWTLKRLRLSHAVPC